MLWIRTSTRCIYHSESFFLYLRTLLYGDMKGKNEITLLNISLRGFKNLLSYIYTAKLSPGQMETEAILEVLALANLYGFGKLQRTLLEYLEKQLSDKNIPVISDQADQHSIGPSTHARCQLMDRNTESILKCEAFNHRPLDILRRVLS